MGVNALATNTAYMWSTVVQPRLGVAPYMFGGSFSPLSPMLGTDCSGAVSAALGALLLGPLMPWPRQFWTGTFAGAQPGDTGPFGGVGITSQLVCIGAPGDAPADAAMVIAVNQNPDPTQAHMICQVGGVTVEMGGNEIAPDGTELDYHTNLTNPNCSKITDPQFNQWFYLPGDAVTGPNIVATGVDYSAQAPGGAALAAAGYAFACRYVFNGAPDLPYKLLTAAEASDLWANGVDIVSNYESTGTSPLNGYDQGVADAQEALANHAAAGGPSSAPIYFSVDFDEAQSQDAAVIAYFQGVASALGLERTGAYGGYWIISRLFNAGVITFGWMTEAWSGDPNALAPTGLDDDYLDPRCQLLQRNALGYATINGCQCDIDVALTANYGQWHYQGEPPPVTNPPDYTQLGYEQLAGPVQSDGYGHGWAQLGTDAQGNDLTVVDALSVTETNTDSIGAAIAAIQTTLAGMANQVTDIVTMQSALLAQLAQSNTQPTVQTSYVAALNAKLNAALDPNANATAQSVADQLAGTSNGNGLSYAEVAFLYNANLLGLAKDYAFPEGSNVSFSRLDQITTLAKILTRSHLHVDGNTYDIWDAVQTILKWVLEQAAGINNTEVNSVNYIPRPPGS